MDLVSNLQTFKQALKDSDSALSAVSLHFADMADANANVRLYLNTQDKIVLEKNEP